MAKPENVGKAANRGQSKSHLVRDAAGNEFEMTQAEWRERDKALGLERVDVVDAEEADDTTEEVPVEGTPTPTE